MYGCAASALLAFSSFWASAQRMAGSSAGPVAPGGFAASSSADIGSPYSWITWAPGYRLSELFPERDGLGELHLVLRLDRGAREDLGLLQVNGSASATGRAAPPRGSRRALP